MRVAKLRVVLKAEPITDGWFIESHITLEITQKQAHCTHTRTAVTTSGIFCRDCFLVENDGAMWHRVSDLLTASLALLNLRLTIGEEFIPAMVWARQATESLAAALGKWHSLIRRS